MPKKVIQRGLGKETGEFESSEGSQSTKSKYKRWRR
jgi:hypothetical protein